MAIKVALFDFDGTLVDSNEAVISMLHAAAVYHRGYEFSAEELDQILGKPIIDQMAFLSEGDKEALVSYYRAAYREVRDTLTRAYPEVNAMLERLKEAGIKIGIVSNKGRNGIDHGMALLGLEPYIDVSISKDDVNDSKPHPEGIFRALEALGFDQSAVKETVFIGDSGHDIETGKNAGCQTILVDWTLLDKAKLLQLKPDYLALTPMAIADYILK